METFQMKLKLSAKEMKEQHFVHFSSLKSRASVTQQCSDNYNLQQMSLHRWFVDFKSMGNEFNLLSSPISSDVETWIIGCSCKWLICMLIREEKSQWFMHLPTPKNIWNYQKHLPKKCVLFTSTNICE